MCAAFLTALWWRFRALDLLPGPPARWLTGNLRDLSCRGPPHLSTLHLAGQYGPLFRLRLGTVPCVVVCDPVLMRELLVANAKAAAGRPQLPTVRILSHNGALLRSMPSARLPGSWRPPRQRPRVQRLQPPLAELGQGCARFPVQFRAHHCRGDSVRVAFGQLRQACSHSACSIALEADLLCDGLAGLRGAPVNPRPHFKCMSMNVISSLVSSIRFEAVRVGARALVSAAAHVCTRSQDSPEFRRFQQYVADVFVALGAGNAADYLPWARFLPSLQKPLADIAAARGGRYIVPRPASRCLRLFAQTNWSRFGCRRCGSVSSG